MKKERSTKDYALEGGAMGANIGGSAGLGEGLAGAAVLGEHGKGGVALAKYLLKKSLKYGLPLAAGGAALGGLLGHLRNKDKGGES